MLKHSFFQTPWSFALFACLFFLPGLGGVHLFDWDEINFAEIAREMIVLDNYLETFINYRMFTEKPPLFMWMQALSMKTVGVGEYGARLPNAIVGIIVLPMVFTLGKKIKDQQFGFLWALAWLGSILPHLYFKSGIIDPVFNLFMFLGLWFFAHGIHPALLPNEKNRNWKALIISGVFAGLAVLTKGPVGVLLIGLPIAIFYFLNTKKIKFPFLPTVVFLVFTLLVIGIWLGAHVLQNGPVFILEFIDRNIDLLTTHDAGHQGFLGYHVVVLILGCFPASIFALKGLFNQSQDQQESSPFRAINQLMIILFWVVLIIFSVVQTKIVHYSSMAYYPITFLGAKVIHQLISNQLHLKKWMKIAIACIGGIAALVTLIFPFIGMNVNLIKPLFSKDPFALANLNADVHWTGFESISGMIMILTLLYTLWSNKQFRVRINLLFFGTAIWILTTLFFYINNIEQISQRAAISFWEERIGEDCYVTTYGYKSYAQLFYSKVEPFDRPELTDEDYNLQSYLLKGEIDKPVYISCKINKHERLEKELTDAEFLYDQNGFYFYKRSPKSTP